MNNYDEEGESFVPQYGQTVVCDRCHGEYVWKAEYSEHPADADLAAVFQVFPTCPTCFRRLFDALLGRAP